MRRTTFVAISLVLASSVFVGAPARAEEQAAEAEDPHAAAGAHHGGGNFDLPEDGATPDPSVPRGTIVVDLRDATDKPIPHADVTLGILVNSVAKGESRKRVVQTTDDAGRARFDNLDVGSGVAYRAMSFADSATFSMPPFQLAPTSGMRALLHVYPVERDVEKTMIVSQGMLYAEVKDDLVQIQQAYRIYNFGKNAWVPTDEVIALPRGFKAFTSQQGMTDVGVDEVKDKGARLRGTFAPGQHVVEFRWQLKYDGEPEVRFDIGTTPHLAAAKVMAPASRDMKLDADGFPKAQTGNDGSGQRILFTERRLRRDEAALTKIAIAITGLPTEGSGKYVATLLAAAGVAFGLVFGAKKTAENEKANPDVRDRLLAELEALERARSAGDIGPKTYEKSRQDVIDALARWLSIGTKPARTKRSATV